MRAILKKSTMARRHFAKKISDSLVDQSLFSSYTAAVNNDKLKANL